jgi:Flp pilus assembly protein TadG
MDKRGQALVEFAIVILLLFLLVFGIFQFGWLMYIKNTLNNAARAGVRKAVVTRPQTPPAWNSADVDSIKQFTVDSVYYVTVPKSDINVCVNDTDCATDNSVGSSPLPGNTITVRVTLNSVPNFTGGFINVMNSLTGRASMRYE